jgi:putative ABC transport system permease protein
MELRLLPVEYAVRNFLRSPRRATGILLGSTLLICLLLAAGAFVRGMGKSLTLTGSDRNVLILGAGSEESVERSEIRADVADLVVAAIPGIATTLGVPYVSPEIHVAMTVQMSDDTATSHGVVLRGVKPAALLVHPQVRIIAGRAPQGGSDEVMVGAMAATQLGLPRGQAAIGKRIQFDGRPWNICGLFEAPRTTMESEIWCPLNDLLIATKRTTVSCVIATLQTAEFADVDAFCKQRLDLELVAMNERDYYAKLFEFFGPIRTLVWVTAALVGLGGLLGGLNTTYSAFASRVREMAALQTLGYSRPAIVFSLLQETLLGSMIGALAACAVTMLLLDGRAVRFSMGSFGLVVDAPVILFALVSGLAMGLLGAMLPAWRCLRLPIVQALRTT